MREATAGLGHRRRRRGRLFETHRRVGRGGVEAQPILDMVVTDSKLADAMRPTFLTFAGDVAPGEPFAHMIENRAAGRGADRRGESRRASTLRAAAVTESR